MCGIIESKGGVHMTQYIGITGRLYPKAAQAMQIHHNTASTRWTWNIFLDMLSQRYEHSPEAGMLSYSKLSSLLPQLKKEYPWLKQADSIAVQCSLKNLMDTFQKFFKKQCGYPKFKSRKFHKLSYTSTIRGKGEKANIRLNESQTKVLLPKVGWVRVRLSRRIDNPVIKSVTITQNKAGYYSLSLLVEHESHVLPKTGNVTGIDVGLMDYASLSNGGKVSLLGVQTETYQKLLSAQRTLSHRIHRAKAKHGKNWWRVRHVQKAKKRVARLHEKIANQRKDALHKLTTELVKNYDIIVIEDLKVSNMMKNKQMARSIANASWRMFRTLLTYKCDMYGKELVVVPPHYTSIDCSICGHRDQAKPLSVREWTCPSCKARHDRDTNAAMNILHRGIA